jgi:hypothetical protein
MICHMNYLCVYCLSYLTFMVTNRYMDDVAGVIYNYL